MIEFFTDYIHYIYLTVIIILIYKLGTIKYNLHIKLGHKGPQPWPFIGNFPQIIRLGFYGIDIINQQKYGDIYPFYFGNIATAVIFDKELLKQILIKEAKNFTDRLDIGFNGKIAKNMVVVLKGKNWESVRNIISPSFTPRKLRKMSPLITDCINLLDERINSHSVEEPFDVKELFGAFSIDVIARSMFGIKIDSQANKNHPFILHAKNLFKFSIRTPMLILFLFFPDIMRFVRKFIPNYEIMGRETLEYFVKQLEMAIDERQKSSEEYNDFLMEMMKAKQEQDEKGQGNSRSLTHPEIIAQALMFLIAGYETTASSLSFVAYFLSMNPEAQQEVYEEILNADYINNEITYESVTNLVLLDAAIHESLRLCPTVPRLDRVCTQNTVLMTSEHQKIYAEKGDVFKIPVYAIHMDPNIWPDPQKFNIHRFDNENKKNISSLNFMGFGIGPRNCVGMRFALIEMKMALISLLKRWELRPCRDTPETITFKKGSLAGLTKPILLKLHERRPH